MSTSSGNDPSYISRNNNVQLTDITQAISRLVSNEVDKSYYSNLKSITKKVGGLLKTDLREDPVVAKNYNKAIEDVLELLRKENERYTKELQFRNSIQDVADAAKEFRDAMRIAFPPKPEI